MFRLFGKIALPVCSSIRGSCSPGIPCARAHTTIWCQAAARLCVVVAELVGCEPPQPAAVSASAASAAKLRLRLDNVDASARVGVEPRTRGDGRNEEALAALLDARVDRELAQCVRVGPVRDPVRADTVREREQLLVVARRDR